MWWSDKYEEHLAHSAPCASRFDGFDRGDLGRDDRCEFPNEHSQRRLSCHRTGAGQPLRVSVKDCWRGLGRHVGARGLKPQNTVVLVTGSS